MTSQTNLFTTKVVLASILSAYAINIRPIQDDFLANGWNPVYWSNVIDFLMGTVTILIARGASNNEGLVYTPKGLPGLNRQSDKFSTEVRKERVSQPNHQRRQP